VLSECKHIRNPRRDVLRRQAHSADVPSESGRGRYSGHSRPELQPCLQPWPEQNVPFIHQGLRSGAWFASPSPSLASSCHGHSTLLISP